MTSHLNTALCAYLCLCINLSKRAMNGRLHPFSGTHVLIPLETIFFLTAVKLANRNLHFDFFSVSNEVSLLSYLMLATHGSSFSQCVLTMTVDFVRHSMKSAFWAKDLVAGSFTTTDCLAWIFACVLLTLLPYCSILRGRPLQMRHNFHSHTGTEDHFVPCGQNSKTFGAVPGLQCSSSWVASGQLSHKDISSLSTCP